MQAIILAAGLGTRMKPVTDKVPKALVPVNTGHGVQKPMLELLLDKLALQGFTHIVVNVHHFAGQIRTFISDYLERRNCHCISAFPMKPTCCAIRGVRFDMPVRC
jgi:NDP-sugar pyrophosphorylase family protein